MRNRQDSAFRHEIVHVRKTLYLREVVVGLAGVVSVVQLLREKNSVDPPTPNAPFIGNVHIQAGALEHVIGSNAVEAVQMVQFPSEVHELGVVTTEDEGGKEVPAWPVVVVSGGLSRRLARRRAVAVLLVQGQ